MQLQERRHTGQSFKMAVLKLTRSTFVSFVRQGTSAHQVAEKHDNLSVLD